MIGSIAVLAEVVVGFAEMTTMNYAYKVVDHAVQIVRWTRTHEWLGELLESPQARYLWHVCVGRTVSSFPLS